MPTMRPRWFVLTGALLLMAGAALRPGGVAVGQAGGPAVAGLERLAVELPAGVPTKVAAVLSYVDEHGEAPPGYEGGRTFTNDGRRGEVVLPRVDAGGAPISYQEWDVNIRRPRVNRGPERLVTGSDGSAYYSADHYQTFIAIRGGAPVEGDPTRALSTRGQAPPAVEVLAPAVAARVGSVLAQVRAEGRTLPDYTGGADYANDGQGVGQVLPRVDADEQAIHYREWDVNPRSPGVARGAERLLTGSDGSAYYTSDLFRTFRRVR